MTPRGPGGYKRAGRPPGPPGPGGALFRARGLPFSPRALPAAPTTRLVIDADLGRDTISRHIYGQFAEHLGRGIYEGVWTKEGSGRWHLRDDVIEALRRIRVPNVRWPGGCFADYYH